MTKGRRPLEPGRRGETTTTPQKRDEGGKWKTCPSRSAERWRARCYYRGHDGFQGELSATGRRKADAEAALDARWSRIERGVSDVEMTDSTPFIKAGEMYLAHIARPDSGKAERTITDYGRTWLRYVNCATPKRVKDGREVDAPSLRGLTLKQANDPQRLRNFLNDIADHVGEGAARSTRSVLMGVFGLAIDNGVLTTNALRQVNPPKTSKVKGSNRKDGVARDTTRALTEAERSTLIAYADAQAAEAVLAPQTRRKRQATADLLAFMAGTGVRISEARTLRWDAVDLATSSIRLLGTKSKAARRRVDLPSDVAARLRRRHDESGGTGYVFHAPHMTGESKAKKSSTTRGAGEVLVAEPTERQWDQSNCARAVAAVLRDAGFPWATPHTLRRTVASVLNAKGVPLPVISDVLGHADPSMTARVYLGRDPFAERPDVAQFLLTGN
ncbi:site-specific integrase [Modestobacter sp. KNN46-3]|jgi:integrase|uniref:tyrosine-type recombinase/integrase n=1 Tax=Modestobacter sp. KNN46-3 TaxID=2711218 RepID=UPI0013DF5B3C|nr:site-specific integrase [Modestobacter sp. KNN46-3]